MKTIKMLEKNEHIPKEEKNIILAWIDSYRKEVLELIDDVFDCGYPDPDREFIHKKLKQRIKGVQ